MTDTQADTDYSRAHPFFRAGLANFPPITLDDEAVKATRAFQRGMTFPQHPSVSKTNIQISSKSGHSIPCVLYYPKTAISPVPAVLWIHGGGFMVGAPDSENGLCTALALGGFAILSPDYRLAPEDPHPAGFEDCIAAWEWLLSPASAEYGINPSLLAAGGSSAGGCLAAALALHLHRNKAAREPALVILDSPNTDSKIGDYPSKQPDCSFLHYQLVKATDLGIMVGHLNAPKEWFPMNASNEDLKGLPPHVFGICELDSLRDEGLAYADRLKLQDVPTSVYLFRGALHAWHGFMPGSDLDARAFDLFRQELAVTFSTLP